MRNKIKIQITYDENLEDCVQDDGDGEEEDDDRDVHFVQNYSSNERGETVVKLRGAKRYQERAIDVPSDMVEKETVVMRSPHKKKISTQTRSLHPIENDLFEVCVFNLCILIKQFENNLAGNRVFFRNNLEQYVCIWLQSYLYHHRIDLFMFTRSAKIL